MTQPETLGNRWRRRHLLVAGMAGTGALALTGLPATAALAAPADAASPGQPWRRATSQNGWPVVGSTDTRRYRVEGSNASVTLLAGMVGTVLLHVVRRFHYEIGEVTREAIVGHRTDRRISSPYESNYLSGTAVALWPDRYPAGARDGLFAHEVAIVRDILADCEGVVRWGGDQRTQPQEGHFQIDVRPGDGRLNHVSGKLQAWEAVSGQGAGTPGDVYSPARRRAASTLADRQRASA
ncbi:hypothetical protein [Micromonospora vulcania]|uniref:Uncharacterized protein n=1 Tax=Micromonospora vulcania TaxID=1441873 RepID=A0ABW1H241_9ACTN